MRTCVALALGFLISTPLVSGGGKDQPKHGSEHVLVKPGEIKWGPAPPGLPPGAEMAVLAGDPSKTGVPFTIRAKLPDGWKVPPHWHPADENVTVLKGALIVGRGDKIEGKGHELPAGSFMHMPKEMHHYAIAKGETILQVHGIGPFDIHYVNPADDPRKK
jgi:mannose-6-phosphate isomerase-like protein (cupin superfamily)